MKILTHRRRFLKACAVTAIRRHDPSLQTPPKHPNIPHRRKPSKTVENTSNTVENTSKTVENTSKHVENRRKPSNPLTVPTSYFRVCVPIIFRRMLFSLSH